mgnify:CR=1 FL=1
MTYGSYVPKSENLAKSAGWICALDTLVAVMAALAIVPVVMITQGEEGLGMGGGFAFISLPAMFAELPGGRFFGTAFFALLFLAALTSAISILESLVAFLTEEFHLSRARAAIGLSVPIGAAADSVTVLERLHHAVLPALTLSITGVSSIALHTREKMVDVLTSYEKTANQIDSIGDEFKQIGNSVANVGRLLTGKGTKEVSDEKEGVAFTRVLNMPVKKHISALKKQVERIDGAVAKLDKVCARLDTGKEKEKEKSRVSVKEKLSQMKVKSEQQKKEPEKPKTKSQEASL